MLKNRLVLVSELPVELTNGNDGRGSKWFRSSVVRKKIERLLRAARLVRQPFESPVTVHVTRLLGKGQRFWDSSSIGRGNWKEIEDALVACGWFHDDGPKWITETRFFQQKLLDHDASTVLVEIFQVDQPAKDKQLVLEGLR